MNTDTRTFAVTLAVVTAVVVGGCSQGGSADQGGLVPVEQEQVVAPIYAPMDRTALGFGLPDLVQGLHLVASTSEALASDEADFARDLIIRPILIERGLGPSAVAIEQKSDRHDAIPTVATSALWVDGVPADLFAEFDPSFYLLLTSVTPDQYRWAGEKPGRDRATILDRQMWTSDWGRFQVVWYTWGEVLYIVLAENQQLLEATLRQMPRPPSADTA